MHAVALQCINARVWYTTNHRLLDCLDQGRCAVHRATAATFMQVHLTQHSALFQDETYDVYTAPAPTAGTITSLLATNAAVDTGGHNESAGASPAQIGAKVGGPRQSQLGLPEIMPSAKLHQPRSTTGAANAGAMNNESFSSAGQPIGEALEGSDDSAHSSSNLARRSATRGSGGDVSGHASPRPAVAAATVFTGAAEADAHGDAASHSSSGNGGAASIGERVGARASANLARSSADASAPATSSLTHNAMPAGAVHPPVTTPAGAHAPGLLVPAAHSSADINGAHIAAPPPAHMAPPMEDRKAHSSPSCSGSGNGSGMNASPAKSATQTELEEASMARSEAEGDVDSGAFHEPPVDISRRRNLRNFESRRPATDFEVWRQAEEALQKGLSVPELVKREFERTLGPGSVECATLCLKLRLFVAFAAHLLTRGAPSGAREQVRFSALTHQTVGFSS